MDIPTESSHTSNLLGKQILGSSEERRDEADRAPAVDDSGGGPPDQDRMRLFVENKSNSVVSFVGECIFYYKNPMTDLYDKEVKVEIARPQINIIYFTSPENRCVGAFRFRLTAFLEGGRTEPAAAREQDRGAHRCWPSLSYPFSPSTAAGTASEGPA